MRQSLPVKILADENIDFNLITNLREASIEVISVAEEKSGISDLEVIDFAVNLGYIILTEDKDFGEWVFSHHETRVGVIFLRYSFSELPKIAENVKLVIEKHGASLYNCFSVITVNKIRIRTL